jgi:NADH-quinone oxidoreductase subunit A
MLLLSSYNSNFISLFIYVALAAIVAIVIMGACFSLNIGSDYNEKVLSYECGFTPFEDARNIFDIKFYLVAILYLIFDLEALFFFPFSINISYISTDGFFIIVDFFIELLVGYFYA